jgi:hypothetical protein
MISSYRLGDLFFCSLTNCEQNEILTEHPYSFGSKYILNKTKNQDIETITKIVINYIETNKHLLPIDVENSTVLHVRLGDVIGGNAWHEKLKRPIDVQYLKSIVPNNNIYIIGKCFFAKPSSTNYDECISLSNMYLENVINTLNAKHFNSGNADIDLCCAVKSKCFIQGKGYYSKLIVNIRKHLNLQNIETTEIN